MSGAPRHHHRMHWTASLWPGLPQLWGRGSWAALCVSVGFTAVACVLLAATRDRSWWEPARLMALSLLLTLLASPYARNYDYIVMIVPLAVALDQTKDRVALLLTIVAYFLPWLAIAVPGRTGGIHSMWLSALLLTFVLYIWLPDPDELAGDGGMAAHAAGAA